MVTLLEIDARLLIDSTSENSGSHLVREKNPKTSETLVRVCLRIFPSTYFPRTIDQSVEKKKTTIYLEIVAFFPWPQMIRTVDPPDRLLCHWFLTS